MENSIGLFITPRMIKKKNGSLFCLLRMESADNSVIIGIGIGMLFFSLLMLFISGIPVFSRETLIIVSIIVGSISLIYLYFNYSGMYITKRKSVLYQNYLITFKINMSKVQGIFILDATTYRKTYGHIYYQDKDTKERMSSILLVKKIEEPMLYRYYFDAEFSSYFPYHVMAQCLYDEDFLAELLKINPNIRVINKTMQR